MNDNLMRGARIVIRDWMNISSGNRVLIVTTNEHLFEAKALEECAKKCNAYVEIMLVEKSGMQVGMFFDENENVFDGFDSVIGACEYSLVTTRAAKRTIQSGNHFLSLPLSTNNGESMLCYDFMTMDTTISRRKAAVIMKYIRNASQIRVITELGSDISFGMKNRKPGFFNGNVYDGNGYSSASMEVYIPIEETMTNGKLILDGSYGYIGRVLNPFEITFENGRIVHIENSESGNRLRDYISLYNDPEMYVAAEFGIGMNSKSRCCGDCYIEDESAYGTFHIGLGRNLALGGVHEASGHYDLVALHPDIYFDNVKIMDCGNIIIPEFSAF